MAVKEFELQMAQKKDELQNQLDAELKELKNKHSLTDYQQLVVSLSEQIEERRKTLKILQDQDREKEEKENFIKTHSLGLTPLEKRDISLLRDISEKMAFKDAVRKLIWSQFYQSKLQSLRKALNADKTTGIYKITNIKNNKAYIGQSVDIGERWTSHVKTGLGIAVSVPNKFYSALLEEGPESFTFEILEVCGKEKLNERERYWIDFFNTVNRGYNTKVGG